MRKSSRINWAVIGVLVVSLLFTFSAFSLAETDVTDKVELVKSRLRYDRRAKTSYLDVSLKNISQDVLLTPIKVVIESISNSSVTVANADGTTGDGKPYFEYTTDTGQFLSGESSDNKKWTFANPNRARFSYTVKVLAGIPEVAGEIGPEGGVVEVTDPDSTLFGVKIEIPEGTSETPILCVIAEEGATPPPLPSGFVAASEGVKLTSSSLLSRYVKVTIPLITQEVNQGDLLGVFHYDETTGAWTILPTIHVDYDSGYVEFLTPYFCLTQVVKLTGWPPSIQLNMDIFMHWGYPLLIQKIKNAEYMIDATSDFERDQEKLLDEATYVAKNLVTAHEMYSVGLTPDIVAGATVQVVEDLEHILLESSEIDPIMDALFCSLEGAASAAAAGHTDPISVKLAIAEHCAVDTLKNAYMGWLDFFHILQLQMIENKSMKL